MTQELEALRVSAEEDLLPLLTFLRDKGIPCRVFEAGDEQVINVLHGDHVAMVQTVYQQWREGKLRLGLLKPAPVDHAPRRRSSWHRVLAVPVTLLLIAGSVIGFLVVQSNSLSLLGWFTYLPLLDMRGHLAFVDAQGDFWRFVTPVFLHFGLLHVTFNSLWTWELGGKIERVVGSWQMLGLFLVMAIVSNVAQFVFGGPSLFGGMSGVVYGLLGFSWVAATINPSWLIRPSSGIMAFMLGWLVFCMTGIMEVVGFGSIANAAHVGGLLAGGVLAVPVALLARA